MVINSDPYFYLVSIPAVLLYGMGKGGLGPALGVIAVPLMSLVISPLQAATIMLPILCIMDIFAIQKFRQHYDLHQLKILLPAAFVGITLGISMMGLLPAKTLKLAIGTIAICFCLHFLLQLLSSKNTATRPNRWAGYFWGILSGFTSAQIHAGGPPITIYLLPQKLDKKILIGTMAIFFAIVNYVKLIPYSLLGFFDSSNLLTSLVLIPLAPVGVKLGYYIMQRVSQQTIYLFLYIMLFLSGIKLCVDGLI